jgi:4-diphosphocytidyl-2C-methyl-D-erythritol kinase
VLLLLPKDAHKPSTAEVYADFDQRRGEAGFDERVAALRTALSGVRRPRDLAALPPNDLASSPLAAELRVHGAFRADVSGAGPTLYGLFQRVTDAKRAARALGHLGRTWITVPAWYG